MRPENFRNILLGKGLIPILNAKVSLNNYQTAEKMVDSIRKNNSNISKVTVYKVVET